MSAEQLIARFHEMGFSLAEMVVLSGAHTLGKVNGIPFTKDLFSFTNSYFKILLLEGETANHLLASDKLLIRHPECRRWVERYALDQDKFFRDFAAAYRKMTLLNC
jgi:L-ascorbate peroxidase